MLATSAATIKCNCPFGLMERKIYFIFTLARTFERVALFICHPIWPKKKKQKYSWGCLGRNLGSSQAKSANSRQNHASAWPVASWPALGMCSVQTNGSNLQTFVIKYRSRRLIIRLLANKLTNCFLQENKRKILNVCSNSDTHCRGNQTDGELRWKEESKNKASQQRLV